MILKPAKAKAIAEDKTMYRSNVSTSHATRTHDPGEHVGRHLIDGVTRGFGGMALDSGRARHAASRRPNTTGPAACVYGARMLRSAVLLPPLVLCSTNAPPAAAMEQLYETGQIIIHRPVAD